MGTRSLTFVYDGNNAIINMYRQFDGYPTGHGQELADFLDGFEIVNGYGKVKPKIANGMGCLAAQMIAHFKQSVGGFYIHPVTDTDCWQDYEYHVYENKVVVKNPTEVIFEGSWDEFHSLCYDTKDEVEFTEQRLITG
jgi:hypothetical protein